MFNLLLPSLLFQARCGRLSGLRSNTQEPCLWSLSRPGDGEPRNSDGITWQTQCLLYFDKCSWYQCPPVPVAITTIYFLCSHCFWFSFICRHTCFVWERMEAFFFFLPKCFLFGFFYLGDLLFLPLGSPRMFGSRIEILCPFIGAVSLEFSYASLCLSGVISGFAKKLQTSNTTQV